MINTMDDHIPPIMVYEDNEGVVRAMTSNRSLSILSKRTKHIDIRYCFTKEAQDAAIINIVKCTSAEQYADVMTKPLSPALFNKGRSQNTTHISPS